MANDLDENDGDEEDEVDMSEKVVERVGLPKEDEVVRKLQDPKLPCQDEVDRHWVMCHMLYRNWRPLCV